MQKKKLYQFLCPALSGLLLLLLLALSNAGFAQDRTIDSAGPSRSNSRSAALTHRVKVFLIAVDDNGKSGKRIGCNDSVVAVMREVRPTPAPLRVALEELLRMPQEYRTSSTTASSSATPELYNALGRSELRLNRVSVQKGLARIHLGGRLTSGGVCDSPRIVAQIEETALQFPSVKGVKVFINGTPLSDYLSERD
jgi:spore germination protein GerM